MMTSTIQTLTPDMMNKQFIENNVVACVRPHAEDEVATLPMLDLDMYFRCVINEGSEGVSSFKVTKGMEERFGLDLSVLRSHAWSKAVDAVTCRSISEVLGLPVDEMPLYVLTTKNQMHGAGAALLCTAKLKELAHRLDVEELFVIPSSIHEVLAIPKDEDMRDAIDLMIQSINATEVSPEDRLSDHVYVFRAEDGSFSWKIDD